MPSSPWRIALLLAATAVACRAPSTPPRPATTIDARSSAPAPAPAPAPAHSPASTESRDLARCPLELRVYELEANAGAPSAPFATGDGVAVVYTRVANGAAERVLHRVDARGTLLPPRSLGTTAVSMAAPSVVVQGGALSFPFANAGRVFLQTFDLPSGVARADAPPTMLRGYPSELTVGPRGVFLAYSSAPDWLALVRDAGRDEIELEVRLTAPSVSFEPPAQALASGARVDVALVPRRIRAELLTLALDAVVLAPGDVRPVARFELARDRNGVQSGVAAGAHGFLVAWSVAPFDQLSLERFDLAGARASAPPPLRGVAPDRVLRYPRVAPLGAGWALSYWDGTSPVVQRLDDAGGPLGAPVEVRSGDERGGHTDARMLATDDALWISWTVGEPARTHGLPGEAPAHPGPRLAVARCLQR